MCACDDLWDGFFGFAFCLSFFEPRCWCVALLSHLYKFVRWLVYLTPGECQGKKTGECADDGSTICIVLAMIKYLKKRYLIAFWARNMNKWTRVRSVVNTNLPYFHRR